MGGWQPSLLGGGQPAFDPGLTGLERIDLGRGAWVDRLPMWLRGHDTVFAALRDGLAWEQNRRKMYDRMVDVPRLVASVPPGAGHPVLADIAAALGRHYGVELDRVHAAYYRSGRDSVAMHGDRIADHVTRTCVAIVSVGAPRKFVLRRVLGRRSIRFHCGFGDLVVMGGTCQRTWQHGVPKVAEAAPRISIMFRSAAESR